MYRVAKLAKNMQTLQSVQTTPQNTSRASGDILEYYTAQAIILHKGRPDNEFTRNKLAHLSEKLTDTNRLSAPVAFFRKMGRFFRDKNLLGFEFTTDNDGKLGVCSDLKLRAEEGNFNLSLKRNNHSVKAQRPSGLHKQLVPEGATRYVAGYARFKKYWLRRLAKYSLFSEIPELERAKMYESFNHLYAKFINEYQPAETLLTFLLSNDEPNRFMIEWNDSKARLSVYNCSKVQTPATVYAEVRKNFITLEFFDADATPFVELSLRLHNASSRITEGFAIKYDTKIVGITNVYPVTVY